MPIRTALLLAAGGLAVAALAGCGDSETNDAATTTSSSVDTTDDATDDTTPAGLDEACVDTIVDYFNNELDLARLADPLYVEEVTADLGECDPAGVDSEQAAEISGRLDADVVAAISGGAPPEDPAATTTPSSTP
jgi:hypothetical protein